MAALNELDAAAPPTPMPAVKHKYGTRARQHSVTLPPVRSRASPESRPSRLRKIRPNGPIEPVPALPVFSPLPQPVSKHGMPFEFPPTNITLHPEDAASKAFLALGRALMSVDNKAVTVKDLSEMVSDHGLACQNISAASQAITAYMRSHLKRCETDSDAPLLLRHTLSGTPSDDDLLPALHSITGGAQTGLTPLEGRKTNFRKGTTVWYLSRAAGAPCPFARAGIRLCDYGENGKCGQQVMIDPRERRRERDRARRAAQCGEKRKRLTRTCADRTQEDDEGEEDADTDSSEDEKRPPKVQLVLRLKPLVALVPRGAAIPSSPEPQPLASSIPPASTFKVPPTPHSPGIEPGLDASEDESMANSSSDSSDDEDDEPAHAWAMPSVDALQSVFPPPLTTSTHRDYETFRRSPSVTRSIASAPPDSEEEEEQFHVSITGRRRSISAALSEASFEDEDDDMDWFNEGSSAEDADDEDTGDFPGKVNVPVNIMTRPRSSTGDSIRDLLDTWEANDDGFFANVSQAHDVVPAHVKIEDIHEPRRDWTQAANMSPELRSPSSPIASSSMATHGSFVNFASPPTRLRLELPSTMPGFKSSAATVVPSPIRDMPQTPLDFFASSWNDTTPSLSSSVSSSITSASDSVDPHLLESHLFGLYAPAEPMTPSPSKLTVADLIPSTKCNSQSSTQTVNIKGASCVAPWEYGLVSPADVEADFHCFFPNLAVATPSAVNSHSTFFEAPPLTPAETTMLHQFCVLPEEAKMPVMACAPPGESAPFDEGVPFPVLTEEELLAMVSHFEPPHLPPLAYPAKADSGMDVEPITPTVHPFDSRECYEPQEPKDSEEYVDLQPRRSSRLASLKTPKTPRTSRAQSSR